METTIDDEAERYLRQLSAKWVRPEQGECLTCFVDRMLTQFGCDGTLRFALFYRDERAPHAASLAQALAGAGGFCDCEILMNAVEPAGGEDLFDVAPSTVMPACSEVPAGSTRPCANWRERVADEDDGWDDDGWDDDR